MLKCSRKDILIDGIYYNLNDVKNTIQQMKAYLFCVYELLLNILDNLITFTINSDSEEDYILNYKNYQSQKIVICEYIKEIEHIVGAQYNGRKLLSSSINEESIIFRLAGPRGDCRNLQNIYNDLKLVLPRIGTNNLGIAPLCGMILQPSTVIADTTSPILSSNVPANNSQGITVDSNIVLTFNENVVVGTGNIIIHKTSDNSVIEAIDVTSNLVTFNGTTEVTINPTNNLDNFTEYYILIDSGAIKDTSNNNYAGISSTTGLSFKTVYKFSNRNELDTAVNLWIDDNSAALNAYGEINTWDVSAITDMSSLFLNKTTFNDDINNWDVSNVTNMQNMFTNATSFNKDINTNIQNNTWNVSNVTNMQGMFNNATAFNQDLNNWDTSIVTNMMELFRNATVFNGNISNWNTSSVNNMRSMFYNVSGFNQDISGWNVSSVTNMSGMFENASSFNQNINSNQSNNSWIVTNVINMENMFSGATSFNQDISGWNVDNITKMNSMFWNANSLSDTNKSNIQKQFKSNPHWPYTWTELDP